MVLFWPCTTFAFDRDLRNAVESVAGIYSSIYIHELGHGAVCHFAGATKVDIEVPRRGAVFGGLTSCDFSAPLTPSERRGLALSGLLAANLAGEAVLQHKGLHGSPYAQSILGTAVVSNVMHVVRYYTRIRGVGGYAGNDIDQYELAGGNPHLLSAALAGYSLWTLHRMRAKEIPLFYVNLRF